MGAVHRVFVCAGIATGPRTPCHHVSWAVDLREVATRAAVTAVSLFPHAEHRRVTAVDPRRERGLWPQGEACAEAHDGVPAHVRAEQAPTRPADCIVGGRPGRGLRAEHRLGSTTRDLFRPRGRKMLGVS